MDKKKLRGGYYTPVPIANFLSNWAIDSDTEKILEPSCGDGNFIETIITRLDELNYSTEEIRDKVRGIEFISEEADKAKERAINFGVDRSIIINSDFFEFIEKRSEDKFDVILGNPPFIRYQNFPSEHREIAIRMMKNLGLSPNRLTNIWVPFLVISASLLKKNGKMGMVIPAELFQVKYAAETRVFLSNFFDRITIITFKKLVFKGIQQEVVLLLCEKKVNKHLGIRVLECDDLDDLQKVDFKRINGSLVKPIDHTKEKWTKYFLTEKEIEFLRELKTDSRLMPCSKIMKVNVGLVTGRNEFFMLTEKQVDEWNLHDYTIPVVSRSNQLAGINFSEDDFREISKQNKSIHLFLPPDKDFDKLPENCQKYIKFGESKGFHKGYKCRIRKRWYITPSLWIPDAFAMRQVGKYPKLVFNESKATSTDTIHRVKFKEKVDEKLVMLSFLNSLTFAFSEITGRSYGGGVMTFEPTEFQDIIIPKIIDVNIDFNQIDNLIRNKEIKKVLTLIDNELLIKGHGFSKKDVQLLHGIWEKLSERRINRN